MTQPVKRWALEISSGLKDVDLTLGRRTLRLTNLRRPVWPALGLTKRDLLQYYADIAAALFPHLCDRPRAIVR